MTEKPICTCPNCKYEYFIVPPQATNYEPGTMSGWYWDCTGIDGHGCGTTLYLPTIALPPRRKQ